LSIIKDAGIHYDIIHDLQAIDGWQNKLIGRDNISVWIDDRLDTLLEHSVNVKKAGASLATFDNRGRGAEICDLNIAALYFEDAQNLSGKIKYSGVEYLILNPDISKYSRLRCKLERIIVTMGGSDTHGVTIDVIKHLKLIGRKATILIGPAFEHHEELSKELNDDFEIKVSVPSLIEEFFDYDLAITGGGITPFEANASGLPCLVVANEQFEIPVGKELEKLGGSRFLGHHSNFPFAGFKIPDNLKEMSIAGQENIKLDGLTKVTHALMKLEKENKICL
jgi:spore coat polysaccharide biosynthesis predicted glycosyltransferase SpsG